MSTDEQQAAADTQVPETRPMDLELEVVVVPVSDADRAKQFYASLGWREDADLVVSEDVRVLQFTPRGSEASIILGTGITPSAVPAGSMLLAVEDIEATRAELVARGVDLSEISPGETDPAGRRGRVAAFSDPDGNEFLLREVTERLPGRVTETSVATLARLLLETALHHGSYEKAAPAHGWWDWYAPYFGARWHGRTPEQATAAADRYMEETHGVVASR